MNVMTPPTQQLGATTRQASESRVTTSHPGSLIWILDDDSDFRQQLQRRIDLVGWRSLAFADLPSLERLLEDTAPHLLVVDSQISGGAGLALVRKLRHLGYGFPIVIVSAQAGLEDRIQGLEAGCNDYLAKPVSPRELELRIENLLRVNHGSTIQISEISSHYLIGKLRFAPAAATISHGCLTTRLSRGESALLAIFCESPTLILTREQLVRASGSLVDVSNSRSLDMRISKLRKLLTSMDPAMEHPIESVRGRGYRMKVEVGKIAASVSQRQIQAVA
jgi:two-component system, OmpR family, phosphate regulon response regulator OmpR